jgi:beta-N-acetylhexosaminidase
MKANDDLKTALGQCFWIGLNGNSADEPSTQKIFETFQPGGVILFQRNVRSFQQVRSLNAALQKLSSIPLVIAIDQEGGTVERLHEIIGTIPPAMALVAAGSKTLARKIHRSHARLLRYLGFNVNFTPVLDLALPDADNAIGTRCFSNDPRLVSQWAQEVIEAHFAENVLPCGKHFPGLGDARLDTHVELPAIASPWSKILNEDLSPYKKLIDRLPFIMVNHAIYPEKNDRMPASLSREIVSNLLLQEWNYNGLAISDDLHMGAISNFYNLAEATERAILAGNHMVLICKPEGVIETFQKLLELLDRNPALTAAVLRNSNRILAFKFRRLKGFDRTVDPEREMNRMRDASDLVSQKAVTLRKGLPFSVVPPECTVFLPHTKWLKKGPSALAQHLRSRGSKVTEVFYAMDITESDAREAALNSHTYTNIVVLVNALRFPNQLAIPEELIRRKTRLAVISGAFPLDRVLRGTQIALNTYWTSPAALKAAAQVLLGERKAHGELPLKV